METVTERETSCCCATLLFTACKKKRSRFYANLVRWGFTPSQQWEPLLPCVAILCVDLSKHDKFVQVKNKAHETVLLEGCLLIYAFLENETVNG